MESEPLSKSNDTHKKTKYGKNKEDSVCFKCGCKEHDSNKCVDEISVLSATSILQAF